LRFLKIGSRASPARVTTVIRADAQDVNLKGQQLFNHNFPRILVIYNPFSPFSSARQAEENGGRFVKITKMLGFDPVLHSPPNEGCT